MKKRKILETYEKSTAQVTLLTRQFSFAGLALIWIFKIETPDGVFLAPETVLPAFLLALTIILDFLQFVYKSWFFGIYNSFLERKLKLEEDDDFNYKGYLNIPHLVLFNLKIITLFLAYFNLVKFILLKIV